MRALSILLIVSIVLTVSSCKENNTGTLEVKGELKNIPAMITRFPGAFKSDSIKLFLYEVPFGSDVSPILLDSNYVSSKNNSFELRAQANKQGLYDVLIENGPMIPLVNDENNIRINIDLTDKDKYYTVSGSPASNEIRDFIFGYNEKSNAANNAFKQLDSLKMYNVTDSTLIAATDQKNNSLTEVNNYLNQVISKTSHPIVGAFILGTASNTLPQNEYESALNRIAQKHPSDPALLYLKKQLADHKTKAVMEQQQSWIGKPAPELVMPDVNGKDIPLSSFKGKYVLVDFWASWCRPCRDENPNVVRAFNEYKSKNFTVLGVSLDKEKTNWIKAIEQDKLGWTHISDLAFWNSKAVDLFKFEGIPYNVLIDPQGIIIAEGLRGQALFNKLGEIIK